MNLPRREWARRVLVGAAGLLASLLALGGSLAYHLTLPETRALVRHLIEGPASAALRGDIDIGRVEEFGLGRARFRDVVIRDPEGRTVIHAPEVTAWPDLGRWFADGTIRIAAGRVEDAEVVLHVVGEEGLEVSLVEAFQPARPGTREPERVHVIIDGLRVERALVHGDVPRYPGLRVEDVHLYGRIDIGEEVVFRVHEGRGRMTAPYPGATELERIDLSFSTDRRLGLDAYAEASRGPSRVRARVRVHWEADAGADEDTPPAIWIRAAAEPICAATLAEMGFAGLDRLLGCAEGSAVLVGPPTSLALRSEVVAGAGRVEVSGVLPSDGRVSFEARSRALDLSRLVAGAPALLVAGRAAITLEPDEAARTRASFEVEAEPVTLSGYAIPGFVARGRLEDERAVVDSIRAPHLGGALAGGGEVGFDGAVLAHLDVEVPDAGADPNVARLVPGLHGAADGGVDVVVSAGAETVDVRWDLVLAPFRYGLVQASRLATVGRVRGPLHGPRVAARASAEGTRVNGLRVGHAEASVEGAGGHYDALLRTTGGEDIRSLQAALALAVSPGGLDVTVSEHAVDLGFGRLAADAAPGLDRPVATVSIRGPRIEFHGLAVAREDTRLSARGRFDPRANDSDLHVQIQGFDLSALRAHLPPRFASLAGTVHATLDLAGDLRDPDATLVGAIEEATLDGRRRFGLRSTLQYSEGVLQVSIDSNLGDTGFAQINGPVRIAWADLVQVERFRSAARLEGVALALDRVNLAFLTPFAGDSVRDLGLAGKITVALHLDGPLDRLEVPWGVVILDNLELPSTSTVRAKIEGSLLANELYLSQVWLADTRGELLRGMFRAELPLDAPPTSGAGWLAATAARPWSAVLEIAPRRLEHWPRPAPQHLPAGVRFGGHWELRSHGDGVVSHLAATATWEEPVSSAHCAETLLPEVDIVADTDAHGITAGELFVRLDGAVVAHASTTTTTPIQTWLAAGELPGAPPTRADIDLHGLALERLPWTCSVASGELDGHAHVTLFSASPDLSGQLLVGGLRVRSSAEAPPSAAYRAELRVRGQGEGLHRIESCLILGREDGARTPLANCPQADALRMRPEGSFAEDGEIIAVASLPLRFAVGAHAPELARDELFFAILDARAAELEPLLIALPGVTQANAIADGTVWTEGSWEGLIFDGGLRIGDGEARIVSMGQYLHDVGGPLRFRGDRIVIPSEEPWQGWDGDRPVSLDGEVRMEGLVPVHVDATARPDRFPFRREGAVLAELSGEVHVSADIRATSVDGVVDTGGLTIALPQTSVGAVQDLALLPDVLVIGEDAPDLGRERHMRFPYRLHVNTGRPVTVSRNDFDVRVSAALDVQYDDPDLTVQGIATIERGTFEVLGKRFAVTRGALAFDGSTTLDPVVDLVATYDLPGRPGATISILASGRLTDLVVDFQSSESSDTGDILALLVSGRASRATDVNTALRAGQQAASFLTGLAGGLLTLSLREQFGDVVPNISLEDGGLGTVAARVGWDVDWIIPDFLRDVVLGAYFEGTFGSRTASGGGGGGVGVGVTMELQFPYNFTASGSYLVPSNGGVDLLWDAF